MHTTSTAIVDALHEAGVSYVFANWGSDHPGLIEAFAQKAAQGSPAPEVVICPNEMVGLSAAHGYSMITGQAQAVLVHVECGTQALAGAIHNVDKGRIPVLILAGASPVTQEGELKGSRNEFIHWIQDVHDQRGIVRGYMRYDNEIRSGRNAKQIVRRAIQLAHSEPQGPVYLMAAREVLEEQVPPAPEPVREWRAISPAALSQEDACEIAAALAAARRPLVVTSYLGRNPHAVAELVALCGVHGIGVLEAAPSRMNYPHDDAMYQGAQWNQAERNPALAEADAILVLDSDVPWIPAVNRPSEGAAIFHIDVDPLKPQMPLWDIVADRSFRADAAVALAQLRAALEGTRDTARVAERRAHYVARHGRRLAELSGRELLAHPDRITPEFLMSKLRGHIDDDTIVLNESITNYEAVFDHLGMTRPGAIFASGGGSLGWNGGAAIGAKLAAPDKQVVAICGDGSYMFSIPSSVHWMARRYETPFVQIVLNNGGWQAPRMSLIAVHPDGHASHPDALDMSFSPAPDYAGIAAAAGGAFARGVWHPDEVDDALAAAFDAVRRERRCAVLDVRLAGS